MMFAVVHERFDIVDVLLTHGADPIVATMILDQSGQPTEAVEYKYRLSQFAVQQGHAADKEGVLKTLKMSQKMFPYEKRTKVQVVE